jgi:hypothetical protein
MNIYTKKMKNLFEITNEERNRVLNLHENATKRQYLTEQNTPVNPQYDALTIRTELDKSDSNEQLIVNVIKKYKQDNFKSLLDTYKNTYKVELGTDIHRAIQKGTDNAELADLTTFLKTIGYSIVAGSYDKTTRRNTGWKITSDSESKATQTQDELINKVSAAVAPAKATESTIGGQKAALVNFPSSNVYFTEEGNTRRFFQYTKDNKTQTRKGFWDIVNEKMTYKEDTAKAENKPNAGNKKVVAPTPSDTDLYNFLNN